MIPGLADWLPRQRWFPGEDAGEVRVVRAEPFADGGVLAIVDTALGRFHVPVGIRTSADVPAGAVIGTADGLVHFDALADPELVVGLYEAVAAGRPGAVAFRPEPGAELPLPVSVRAMGVEQSNTSVVIGGHSVLKVFRRVWPGENPDVTLHRVLRESPYVPDLLGTFALDGTDTLGLVESFVADAVEGWSAALDDLGHVLAGRSRDLDLVGGLGRLGVAVAGVHGRLGRALGFSRLSPDTTADRFLGRLDDTLAVAPELAPHASALRVLLDERVRSAEPAVAHRVHGDLHLGQVLLSSGQWTLLDFEGEPSASPTERARADSPLRDVAGMLRSFDYVAGHHRLDASTWSADHERRSRDWVRDARRAFLTGYSGHSAVDLKASKALLRAYELDKALYEVRYESANRPEWRTVPLRAVRDLIGPVG
ncbi:maltokinase N-terminal cap-like domain-containing protein [Saccharothrix violaceirubra]|uniref:Maltokinase n=1 Tax=Saccharothrix violaceirubra TaxID=413306 RepID=A0A7W7T6C5_9PSEU|nr:phosphotransferase [Saccharothrix violaceirubra]MBB4967393.1 maltokinase [Saccharothrix violaceirubra]